MKNKYLIITLITFSFLSCSRYETRKDSLNEPFEWKLVYKNDENGQPIFGDKKELLSIIRKGYPLRVGWASRRQSDTTKTVEHTVDVKFITIANGNEVFVQIQPFFAQRPNLTSDTLSMSLLAIKSSWILGTNGLISSVSEKLDEATQSTSPPKLFGYSISWFAKISGTITEELPLWNSKY